jgi:hypothetical protein
VSPGSCFLDLKELEDEEMIGASDLGFFKVVGTRIFPLSFLERGLKSFSVSGFPNS